jgi:hypothetical protein
MPKGGVGKLPTPKGGVGKLPTPKGGVGKLPTPKGGVGKLPSPKGGVGKLPPSRPGGRTPLAGRLGSSTRVAAHTNKLSAAKRAQFKGLVGRLDRTNRNTRRPNLGRSQPTSRRVPPVRTVGRPTPGDRQALRNLARTNAAAANMLRFHGRARTPAMVNRARSALAGIKDPAAKVALARSIRTSYFLRSSQMRSLVVASNRWGPRGQGIMNTLLGGGRLSRADIAFLRGKFLLSPGLLRWALAAAIRDALFLRGQWFAMDGFVGSYGGSFMPGGGWCGGFAGGDPGSDDGGDVPEVPSVQIPNDGGDPNGPGVNLSVTPGDDDPAVPPVPDNGGQDDAPTGPPPEDTLTAVDDATGEVVQADQTTRKLRLGNNSKNKVKFFVQYQTQNGKGQENWYPARPNGEEENALQYELEPGQTIDVKDNDWRVSANKVRIWARGGGQEWNRFKNRDLPVVPDKDPDGKAGSYKAPVPQNLNFIVH